MSSRAGAMGGMLCFPKARRLEPLHIHTNEIHFMVLRTHLADFLHLLSGFAHSLSGFHDPLAVLTTDFMVSVAHLVR